MRVDLCKKVERHMSLQTTTSWPLTISIAQVYQVLAVIEYSEITLIHWLKVMTLLHGKFIVK